jgi:hypothetical protein
MSGRKVVDGSKLGKTAKKRRFFVFFAPILTKISKKNHKNWTIFCSFNLNYHRKYIIWSNIGVRFAQNLTSSCKSITKSCRAVLDSRSMRFTY